MTSDQIVVLCPRERVALDLPMERDPPDAGGMFGHLAEDAVEEIVVCLAATEAAWAAGEFGRLSGALASLAVLTERTGMQSVAAIAGMAQDLIGRRDDVALAAVVSRLVRVGEASLVSLLEISYRQI